MDSLLNLAGFHLVEGLSRLGIKECLIGLGEDLFAVCTSIQFSERFENLFVLVLYCFKYL